MKESNIKGLILAAGRGSRMDQLTSEHPKCFTELGGKRLIDWQLESFDKVSINQIAIVTGYLKEQFDEYQKFNKKISSDLVNNISSISDPNKISDLIAANINSVGQQQAEILEEVKMNTG